MSRSLYAWFDPKKPTEWVTQQNASLNGFEADHKIIRNGEDGWRIIIDNETWFVGYNPAGQNFFFEWRPIYGM